MRFPPKDRIRYRKNTIYEVIFQARFPEILRISNEQPVEFQDKVRKKDFPEIKIKKTDLPSGIPDQLRRMIGGDEEYTFLSEDQNWRAVLTKEFVALVCNQYTNYEDFAARLQPVLTIFTEIYEPTYFGRIGLRYKNLASATVLEKEVTAIRAFIPQQIAPELKTELSDEVKAFEKTLLVTDDFCKVNIRHILGQFTGKFGRVTLNNEESYIIDIDCFTEQKIRKVEDAISTSRTFNEKYVRNIFQWSITPELHGAMEPLRELD